MNLPGKTTREKATEQQAAAFSFENKKAICYKRGIDRIKKETLTEEEEIITWH